MLGVLCAACEYDELPVRHNEDKLNAALAQDVRLRVELRSVDDPHTKANLLLQARAPLAKAADTCICAAPNAIQAFEVKGALLFIPRRNPHHMYVEV